MIFRKREAKKMMDMLTESEAYKMYSDVKKAKQEDINDICAAITDNIIKQVNNKQYVLKGYINRRNVTDYTLSSLLEYSKEIKSHFRERGYKVRTFVFVDYGFNLTLFIRINWKFK